MVISCQMESAMKIGNDSFVECVWQLWGKDTGNRMVGNQYGNYACNSIGR